MTPSEEKALIARCKRDPQAFGRIFDAHFDPVFNFILHRVADTAVAEDLTAQTFFNALKSLWKFRWSGTPISAWFFRIAINEVNGHLRKNKNRFAAMAEEPAQNMADRRYQPDQELVDAEAAKTREKEYLALHECLQALEPMEQSLIVFRYFDNKPYSEIARILRKREGSLRMRTFRALEKLKQQLIRKGIRREEPGKDLKRNSKTGGEKRELSAEPAAQST